MLKAAGLFLLFSGCFSLGIGKSRGLKKRLELLRELKKLLLLLSGEIRCAKTPLPEAFRKIGRKAEDPFGTFFQKVAEELTGEGRKLPETAFYRQMKLLKESPLTPEDRSFLLDLGKDLGYPDLSVQLETLKLFEENLEELIKKAAADYRGKAKVYRYLGALAGLFLVVFLI